MEPPELRSELSGPVPLRELQKRFQHHLLTRDDAIMMAVLDAPPLRTPDRLKIYGNAYLTRLIDSLHDTYPSLHKILGDDMFMSLGEAFVDTHPSVHRSIRWYGRELENFVRLLAPYSDQPILGEVARFEWTLSEVFDAPDALPIPRTVFQAVHPGDWAGLRLRFHPSLRRMSLAWNTVAVWQRLDRDEEPPQPQRLPSAVPWLLWRQDLMNRFRSLAADENAALDAAIGGRSFGEICGVLEAWLPSEEIPLRAANLIGTWADSGIITDVAVS